MFELRDTKTGIAIVQLLMAQRSFDGKPYSLSQYLLLNSQQQEL
jgi:hypothetical protein